MVAKRCALCGQTKELELSHIVPKFVIRYLKKTSLGAIRNKENLNKVVQDGEKHYLLCGDCEDLFSIYETKFANKFFYPYMKDDVKEFNYDSDLYYFLTSVSWRSLYLDILDFVEHSEKVGIDLQIINCLIEKERGMREYLLKKQPNVKGIENHILFFEDIKNMSTELVSTRPHTTFHRSITSYTFFNKELKTYATLTNMMGIILFTLYNKGEKERWENTEITNGVGLIKAANQVIESICADELVLILKDAEQDATKISEKQQEAINKKVKDRPEEFIKSKVFEDLKKDFDLKKGDTDK
ncbi:hypothetical protein [Clostridium estertheticum]|uniref:hypothetical protein n=1 Tax=Clostridium estertheticum TaxID=238834 RepID=UPI001CF20F08|nr:hypothetical protein [Clostridium estertheticum]MCB2353916.1 hypothetical protein [Clostridium estertheticum]WAG43057.1 hypothetical protein LL065_10405 [Clostridium estertheticum]